MEYLLLRGFTDLSWPRYSVFGRNVILRILETGPSVPLLVQLPETEQLWIVNSVVYCEQRFRALRTSDGSVAWNVTRTGEVYNHGAMSSDGKVYYNRDNAGLVRNIDYSPVERSLYKQSCIVDTTRSTIWNYVDIRDEFRGR